MSTDQGCFAEIGAHRAPYDKDIAASETASELRERRLVRNAILLQPDTPVKMNGKAMGSKCASTQITWVRSKTDTWKAGVTLDRKLRRGEEEETGSSLSSSSSWELPRRWYLGELPGRRDRAAPWCWTQALPIKTHALLVKYVGDAACIRCHGEIGESYRSHPMGRSLSPIAPETAPRVEITAGAALFESDGLQYSVENRGGHVIHLETRRALGWDCRSEYGGGSVHARLRETGAGLPDRARRLPVSVADHALRAIRTVGLIPGL